MLFNSYMSAGTAVRSDAPHANHLDGPFSSVVSGSRTLMYTDDVKLFHSSDNVSKFDSLRSDLLLLVKWCEVNRMTLNIVKCECLHFSRTVTRNSLYFIYDEMLKTVSSIYDLGVLLDAKCPLI